MFENRPIVTYSLRKDKHTACTNGWVKKDPITCKDMCLVLMLYPLVIRIDSYVKLTLIQVVSAWFI